ncbi:hypothetical protein Airi02_102940 [Actinoallomurus iriomotensis]|uniref:Uncharacterized protein n=1 Tax=Actinoallomurus iriomotensis TaxID=478107 RepID=A0A9W6SCJ5_9ACTN|nr:hypothetical protein Airi02_102940 [Actinoallomurus iriomotensis]
MDDAAVRAEQDGADGSTTPADTDPSISLRRNTARDDSDCAHARTDIQASAKTITAGVRRGGSCGAEQGGGDGSDTPADPGGRPALRRNTGWDDSDGVHARTDVRAGAEAVIGGVR